MAPCSSRKSYSPKIPLTRQKLLLLMYCCCSSLFLMPGHLIDVTCIRTPNGERSNVNNSEETSRITGLLANETKSSGERHSQGLVPPNSSISTSEAQAKVQVHGRIDAAGYGGCRALRDLEVMQDVTRYLPSGMPMYRISVVNTCPDCSMQDIHIACGSWASATEVNPAIFRKVDDNDCVVKDGSPLDSQDLIYFEYSNSFPYPMDVRRATVLCS